MRRRWLGRRIFYWVTGNAFLVLFLVVAFTTRNPLARGFSIVIVAVQVSFDLLWIGLWAHSRRRRP